VLRNVPRYVTTFQRCSAVSEAANAGIAVPVTPTEIFRNVMAGVTAAIVAGLPMTAGFGVNAAPAAPSPMPATP